MTLQPCYNECVHMHLQSKLFKADTKEIVSERYNVL